MTDEEAFDILEGAIGMIEGEWGEGDGSDEAAISHLRARLTTAEQEREQLREFLAIADGRAGTEHTNRVLAENDRDLKAQLMERYVDDLEAAEARVEALEVALREIGEHGIHGHAPGGKCGPCVARAALACPPRLGFNPEPMQVVERRDDVTGVDAIRGRSRDDRLRVWLALGGTEDNFPVAACPPQQPEDYDAVTAAMDDLYPDEDDE